MVMVVALLLTLPALMPMAEVTLPSDLKPMLATHCVECHEGARAKGQLDLEAILQKGVISESALRELRRRLVRRDMPPRDELDRPTDAAYRAAVATIDACVPPASREVPAVRRLNRAQYAGAVHDVLGVDGAMVRALLPADEIGEGFDTTAATLTLSPLLMEKYLDAAERLADEVVAPTTRAQRRVVPAEKLERTGQGGTYDGIAWLSTVGTLSLRFEAMHAGQYAISLEARAQHAGTESPRFELVVDGHALGGFAVDAPEGTSAPFRKEIPLGVGPHTVAARFTNDFWDPKVEDPKRRDRNFGLASVVVEGPLGPSAETAFSARVREIASDGPDVLRLRRVASVIGGELFRRALEPSESDALAATARLAVGVKASFETQLRALVTVLLADPRFLLRVELPASDGALARHPLRSEELASRLSFFLWSSVPDAELRRAQEAGELAEDAPLRTQVRRMLADARATSLSSRFAAQWLGIDGLETRQLDPARFPRVDAALLTSMRRETEHLFEEIVRGARPVRALIDSRTKMVDARLAAHYQLPAPSQSEWEVRTIAPERGAGVLGHSSMLVATSNPNRTSPVKRGKWVLQSMLDDAPPPPPPGTAQLPESAEERRGLSMRELLAVHRANPDCASCHNRMDALGLALERLDVDGAVRTEVDGKPVDDSGAFPDGTVLHGVRGVEEFISRDRAFERSLSRQLLVYALGRGTADADDALIDALAARLAEHGEFAALVEGIVTSDAFRTRMDRVVR